jgi:hypothetical protein
MSATVRRSVQRANNAGAKNFGTRRIFGIDPLLPSVSILESGPIACARSTLSSPQTDCFEFVRAAYFLPQRT